MRHFLSLKDYEKSELLEILSLARDIKRDLKAGKASAPLTGKTLAMIFEKSSTRTRVSFEIGAAQLGMQPIFLSSRDIQLGRGEPMKDTARVISRLADMVMIRTFAHSRLEEFAAYSSAPVINGLSDDFHPAQLMADYMTMQELGYDERAIVAWIGDGNNMANSYLMLASKMGFELRVAAPKGYEIAPKWIELAKGFALTSGAKLRFCNDPKEAIRNANIVATDVWTSMGQEEESKKRLKDFAGFGVSEELFALADKKAALLHCLPAHRGEEVTDALFEAHADSIFLEAENRLHAQKGVMLWLSGARKTAERSRSRAF
ncbi:MAG: ornithine carbamoyltransferase [Helicobacteraceae bacterium]|jgi:ornithine carbamoyltransferase|nr:ornithine carbamoyltransferase [Helicobacteraceae bacterium]